ncbi:PA domain-containing protein [Pseudofulvimonas gallinarii]|jgi:hypothetical protein|uniref:PA domain-containing protein n=1 Tax=Pseudofulvimonas gallinarii TaxID=634155 RepID=A0A4S3KXQ4_9GAMM|nr:PA domain-containing protein [Pseudofulvimonas gallinarii]TCT00314.1 PA domain-containing protein [Pseudofulvimonas gallinarii]THD14155.1 hypothetical protein B1808_04770 [Pseudofulvimonas gallinarii]
MARFYLLLAAMLVATPVPAAEMVIVNTNAGGAGLNDPSPARPEAGVNGGTTLGAQRLRVLQRAAEIWAAALDSPVPIRIEARMVELPCSPASNILGQGGPLYMAWNFSNAPRRDTAYPIALANALARRDLDNGADIRIDLNISVDNGCMDGTVGWWYGLDPADPGPADRYPLLPVVLHEIAHGLGFLSSVNPGTGEYYVSMPTLWSNYLYDQQAGKHWRNMTAAERAASARNDPYLVWTGDNVNRQLSNWLLGILRLDIEGVRGGERRLSVATAEFGGSIPSSGGPAAAVVTVNDGIAAAGDPPGTFTDGCEYPFLNGNRLQGRIALVDRGSCTFVEKARNAQEQGAVALLVANNVEGTPPTMGGVASDITIPVLGITREEGARLKRSPAGVASAQPSRDETLSGTRAGCMRMYAPASISSGSSVTHFHSEATPSLLMEPGVSPGLGDQLDMTLDLLRDLGWVIRAGGPPATANDCAQRPLP